MAPRIEKLEEANSVRPPFLELQPGDLCRGSTGSPTKEPSAPRRDGKVLMLFNSLFYVNILNDVGCCITIRAASIFRMELCLGLFLLLG